MSNPAPLASPQEPRSPWQPTLMTAVLVGVLLAITDTIASVACSSADPTGELVLVSAVWLTPALIVAVLLGLSSRVPFQQRRALLLVATVSTVALGVNLARTTFNGRRAAQLPLADELPWIAATAVVVGGIGLTAGALLRAARGIGRRAAWWGFGTMTVAFTANALLLPRDYPAVHAVCLGFAVLGATELAAVLSRALRARWWLALGLIGLPGIVAIASRDDARVLSAQQLVGMRVWARPLLEQLGTEPPPPRQPMPPDPWDENLLTLERGQMVAAGLPERPNVLLITIDALRADRVGCCGGKDNLTPSIDALGAKGAVFTQVRSVATSTFQVMTSLLTARRPDRFARHPAPDSISTLGDVARAADWRTYAGFPKWALLASLGPEIPFTRTNLGFDTVDDAERSDAERIDRFLEFAAGERSRPFCAWIHLMSPHAPYSPQDAGGFAEDAMSRYEAEVRSADRQVGRLVRALDALALLPQTVLFVGADHGEEFGEHGTHFHGLTVYDQAAHVPLVISGPGIPHVTVTNCASLVDLVPTMAHVAHWPIERRLSGRSLIPLAFDPRVGRDRLVWTIQERPDHDISLRAVLRWPWKLIRDGRTRATELYDLEHDPGETNNLTDVATAVRRELLDLVRIPPQRDECSLRSVIDDVRKLGRDASPDPTAWWSALRHQASAVRRAAVDTLAARADADADALLRAFANADGPATEGERRHALARVNERPLVEDLASPFVRMRHAAATAIAYASHAFPPEPIAHALASESDRETTAELLRALRRTTAPASDEVLRLHAGHDDSAGALAAHDLAMRYLNPDGTKRSGAPLLDATELASEPLGSAGFRLSIPSAPNGTHQRVWVILLLDGDGTTEELATRAQCGQTMVACSCYRNGHALCLTLCQQSAIVQVTATATGTRPRTVAAFSVPASE